MNRETCPHRKTIFINLPGIPPGHSLEPCCTHPDGPKVVGLIGVPYPDPWYCDAAIEEGKCPLGYVDKTEVGHE